jgi:hypothetical protein
MIICSSDDLVGKDIERRFAGLKHNIELEFTNWTK